MEEDRGKQGSLEGKEIEAMRGNPIVQLNLLPLAPVQSQESLPIGFPWTAVNGNLEASTKLLDVNQTPFGEDAEEGAAISLSPNSSISSFPMELAGGMDFATAAVEAERASSKGSDDEDNGGARKKLRLSKEQSAFLEESFKEQNTLNPKQKLALAKQLNLRPRQVEVWFQNRRARTKLKQTEVDCEYLKRCCDTLREENRRLRKELTELRALKTPQPFYMQLPATTLSMCPSCERVAPNPTSVAATGSAGIFHSRNEKPSAATEKPPATSISSLISNPHLHRVSGSLPTSAHKPSAAS
ncbi:hypothetical protein HPP92_019159 [Vanilla planifolia]|uniref:Homeobox domain-containing protein n=1 Tax=Vanilla planifolia TaxID=51239 RepID=A0A835QDG0_VANPL|nr:hypothetical protein HPP92_019159 [Vanilla planifolia]